MNTIAARPLTAPQPLVSATARIATAAAVAVVLAFATLGATKASHQAVQTVTSSISTPSAVKHVTFERVVVVGRRTNDEKKI
ncbi:MAG TPA: hypothetical protein VK996_16805 [Ramlibacter sp.]|nr:hypothetical protein [Ramlibacter sp.]